MNFLKLLFRSHIRRKVSLAIGFAMALLTIPILFGLGCSGFKADLDDLSSETASTEGRTKSDLDLLVQGANLYTQNCASCHGPLATTSRMGRTSLQILAAVSGVPAMAMLANLSTSEIAAIAAALASPRSIPSGPMGPSAIPGSVALAGETVRFKCTKPMNRGLGEVQSPRLTRGEIINTMTDILGADIVSDSFIQTQFKTLLTDVIQFSVLDIAPAPADIQPTTMFKISSRVSDLINADSALRVRIFGACSTSAQVTPDCAQQFIQSFGLKTYRRPLSQTEAATLFNFFQSGSGPDGFNMVMMRLLMAPTMTYHIEIGVGSFGNRNKLSDYEIASRISYRIAATLPDDALFKAAAAGELHDLTRVRMHVKRLLQSRSGAKNLVNDFFRFYTQNDQVLNPNTFAAATDGIDPNGLQSEFVQETNDFVNHIVWNKNGPFKDLLTSNEVFPRSTRMAKILQTTVASGASPTTTTSAHAGLILRPALFVNSGPFSKPYHRAALVRKGYLCEKLGMPDANSISQRTDQLGDLTQLSVRDRLTKLTNVQSCLSCHSLLNPIGFALEGYDQLGMLRTQEITYNANGLPTSTHPLDTQVSQPFLIDGAGNEISSIRDGIDLARSIADGNQARACFAQRIFEFQRAREVTPDDECALSEIEAAIPSATILDDFVNAVANEDLLWKPANR